MNEYHFVLVLDYKNLIYILIENAWNIRKDSVILIVKKKNNQIR